jgi:hypothetical protein
METWNLELTTFGGICVGAKHFYGVLYPATGEPIRLEYRPDAEQSALLSEAEWEHPVGMETERFFTSEDVLRKGIEVFQEKARGPQLLLLGQHASRSTKVVISSIEIDPARVATLNEIHARRCSEQTQANLHQSFASAEELHRAFAPVEALNDAFAELAMAAVNGRAHC